MARWMKVGEFDLAPPVLEIFAIRGVVVECDRIVMERVQHTLVGTHLRTWSYMRRHDAVWIKTPDNQELEVSLGANRGVSVRIGHEATVWYAGSASPEQYQMVAFENHMTGRLYDFSSNTDTWFPPAVGRLESLAIMGGGFFVAYLIGSPVVYVVGFIAASFYMTFKLFRTWFRVYQKRKGIFTYINSQLRGRFL